MVYYHCIKSMPTAYLLDILQDSNNAFNFRRVVVQNADVDLKIDIILN